MPGPGNSVFGGNQQAIEGVIKAEDVKLKINNRDAVGAIVQQAEWSLERTVNMLYEIGTQNVYYVGDRRRGQARFSRVVGGSKDFKSMVSTYGDLCQADTNTLGLNVGSTSCGGGGSTVNYTLLGVTLQSIGASVTANDIIVTESMSFMFVDMLYT
jgi:hypothetical protein